MYTFGQALKLSVLTAVAVGIVGFAVVRAQEPAKKPDAPKPDPKKDDNRLPPIPEIEDLLRERKDLDAAGIDAILKRMEATREEMQRALLAPRFRMAPQGRGFGGRGASAALLTNRTEGRLGALIDRPNATLVDQLDLPEGQGVVMQQIHPDSPADKAGFKPHDILLELDGQKVPSDPEEVVKQVNDLKSGKPIKALVMRKGKKETIKGINLPEIKIAGAELPEVPAAPMGGRGISTSISRTNDNFTILHQSFDTSITITGKVVDGKPVASHVIVLDSGETYKYDGLDKVAEKYRDQVKGLLEQIGGAKKVNKDL